MVTKLKPVTERHEQLFAMPTIASQLPVDFDNGCGFEVFDGYCNHCGKVIPSEMLRGSLTRPFHNVAVIDAVGICVPCRVLTEFYNRMHDDMRITAMRDGVWCTWRAEQGALDAARDWLSKLSKWLFEKVIKRE